MSTSQGVFEFQYTSSHEGFFETESLDLAACLVVAGYAVEIYRNAEGSRAVFSFRENAALRSAIMAYERGACLPAKRLLNARSYLFREASRVVKEGRQ